MTGSELKNLVATPIVEEDEDYYLFGLLVVTREAIMKLRKKELSKYHITPRQAITLIAVQAIGLNEATPSKVARWIFRERHSVSELLMRMEVQGLVERVKAPGQKKVRITITNKGRDAWVEASRIASIHSIMSSLSEEKRQELKSCLKILLSRALQELGIKHGGRFPKAWLDAD